MPTEYHSPRRYIFFAFAVLGLLMTYIDVTIITVAIPALTRSLGTSLNWVSWTLTGYMLVQIVVTPLAGKLSDDFGRKRIFLFSIGCFTVGSLLCGLAPNIGFLIVFRVLQAIGGGGMMPSAVGIISDQFKEGRSRAIGLVTSFVPIGGILGPNIGGWIIEHWSWREIFFINVPIGVAIMIGIQLLLREQRKPSRPGRIDLLGLLLFASAVIAFMYAMTVAGTDAHAWQSPLWWLFCAGAITLFVLFVRQERRTEQPMVDTRLLFRLPYLPANLYNFLFGACAFGLLSFVPYFAVVQYQMSAGQSGAVLTPRMIAVIVTSLVTSLYILRFGYRTPMITGALLISMGLTGLSLGLTHLAVGPFNLDGFWLMATVVAITGMGVGLSAPSSSNAVIDLLPSRAAALAGLRGMFQMTGGIICTSAIVLVLSFFEDKAAGMRTIFLALAILLLAVIPLTLMIPDSARERRRRRLGGEGATPMRSIVIDGSAVSDPAQD